MNTRSRFLKGSCGGAAKGGRAEEQEDARNATQANGQASETPAAATATDGLRRITCIYTGADATSPVFAAQGRLRTP